eukprot:767095-Hanusia_phi.AAC.3
MHQRRRSGRCCSPQAAGTVRSSQLHPFPSSPSLSTRPLPPPHPLSLSHPDRDRIRQRLTLSIFFSASSCIRCSCKGQQFTTTNSHKNVSTPARPSRDAG